MRAEGGNIFLFLILIIIIYQVHSSEGTVAFEEIDGIEYPPDTVPAVAIFENTAIPGLNLGRLISDTGAHVEIPSVQNPFVWLDGTGMVILGQSMDHENETLCPGPIDTELSCKVVINILEGSVPQTIHLYLKDFQDQRPEIIGTVDCLTSFPENTPLLNVCRFIGRDGDRWIDKSSLSFNYWAQFPHGTFNIDPISGVLTLNDVGADYETSTVCGIYVKLMDSEAGHAASYSANFVVQDLPDTPPIFQPFSPSTLNVSEELLPGTKILTCVARDGDVGVNDGIEYTFYVSTGTDSHGIPYFALDNLTGHLTVNTDLDTDEILGTRGSLQFNLTVMATEVHDPRYSVSQPLTIVVQDGDKYVPRFEDGSLSKIFDVVHSKNDPGRVLNFSIMDSDTDLAHNEYRAQLVPNNNLPWLNEVFELTPLVGSGRTVFELKIINSDKINYDYYHHDDTVKKSASPINFQIKITATMNPMSFVEANIFLTITDEDEDNSISMYISITAGILAVSALVLLAVHLKSKIMNGLDKMADRLQDALPIKKVPTPPGPEVTMSPAKTVQWQGWDVSKILVYDRKHEIPLTKFKLEDQIVLGEGAFGVVSKAYLGDKIVAAKTTRDSIPNSPALEALMSELKILTYLGKHDHVIEVVGACTKFLNEGQIHIFVQFCPLGDLESFLRRHRQAYLGEQRGKTQQEIKNGGYVQVDVDLYTATGNDDSLPIDTIDPPVPPIESGSNDDDQNLEINISKSGPTWSMQIADGMDYLQSKEVIHADLAARNVLLVSVDQIKITDFGLSRRLNEDKDVDVLPWRWMSLETLRDKIFTSQSDVWSYGVTLWEIFSLGEVPYDVPDWCPEFLEDLVQGRRLCQPLCTTSGIYHHLLNCWKEKPEARPSFSELRDIFQKLIPTD